MEARAFIRKSGQIDATGILDPVPWWSFTKTAFSIAMLYLSERGRINLDEPVTGKPFTPAQLLRHEAGLPDYGSLPSYHADVEAGRLPWSVGDMLNEVEADRLRYEPGHGWAYSNIGYWQVARLIEKASGLALADALADLVFIPAELATARLAVTPDDLADVRMGDVVGYHPGWVYPGLVVGTAADAARLLHGLFNGALLGPETLTRMLDRKPLPKFRSEIRPDPAYGLGLMMYATNPLDNPIGHSGSGPGSRIAVYAKHKMTSAVWTATTGADPEVEVFRSFRNGGF